MPNAVVRARWAVLLIEYHWWKRKTSCYIRRQCGMSELLGFVVGSSCVTQPYTHFTSMHEFPGSWGLGAFNSLLHMFPIWNKTFLVQEVSTPFSWGWAIKDLLGCKLWVVIMQWEGHAKCFLCRSGYLTKSVFKRLFMPVSGKPLPQVVPWTDSWGKSKMKPEQECTSNVTPSTNKHCF